MSKSEPFHKIQDKWRDGYEADQAKKRSGGNGKKDVDSIELTEDENGSFEPQKRKRHASDTQATRKRKPFDPQPEIVEGPSLNPFECGKHLQNLRNLTGSEDHIADKILRHRNNMTLQCNPSIRLLTLEACVGSYHTVQKAIRGLVDKDELIVVKQSTEYGRLNNFYFFTWDFGKAYWDIYKNTDYSSKPPLAVVVDEDKVPLEDAFEDWKDTKYHS